jgi:nicotinate-nucleotide pyrophosphorylase (carboxylating)
MPKEFAQLDWNDAVEDDCRQLVRLAVREDLARTYDWTTVSLVPQEVAGAARVVSRGDGVICGLQAAAIALDEMGIPVSWVPSVADGDSVSTGASVAELSGPARDLLTAERILLNFIGRLSGVATLTRQYAAAIEDTPARIYDTRKTTPGWRRLEKYAVRRGGGQNHRQGLYEAVLIKDNHLAFGACHTRATTPAGAIRQARQFLVEVLGEERAGEMIVEIEVDTLEQLEQVLPQKPDIVLLDNMPPDVLRRAVEMRNEVDPDVKTIELEASGGIDLTTIRSVALTGVERISVGALTHSAVNFDVGLDWLT